ncbi:zinc finger CCHC domain-containing protein 8 isoform X1 [Anolis carolinensis]|uniref:zinc finger CCHC domain-containing protein 8 isoform X1 n=1 Tax=Anolis carolinensis TaxID=28377 RepID=UPI000462D973|nr:PREDICTED: zinc finger CCHC domain-containing protein 8 isoform X1 [Anolis carolinensis]|eukprot:XP_008118072.1 PREDICTED: zinc finger CCHC domain-containing protein 8 isoform X1 [Anolis carolinensis]
MAARVDFGDRELFQQLDAEADEAALDTRFGESDGEDCEELRQRLSESQEAVRALQAENRELRRKLNILTRPSGLTIDDAKVDGPLLQILSMNNNVSKQYHQEIEDFIVSLVQRYEEQQRAEPDKTYFSLKPQPSSFVLEEDPKVTSANMSKKIKEAFSVIGSVLYFTNFCLDKLGQPILNENPQLTDGWEIPKYQQVFTQILSLDGQEIQVKPKSRPKPHCFNCGLEDHQMKDCPQPRNAARISEKRKQFMDACGEANNQNFQQRYHADEIDERFGRFKPGIISEELQDALGVTEKSLPPFIYRMRQLGYPPGWLKEAEMEKSGLTLYDGKASPGDEAEEEDDYNLSRRVTYDISKLINYPGFNMSTPNGVSDEWRLFGSVPLQPSQQKDIFAHYLSTYRSAGSKSNSKRLSSHQSSHRSKRQKGNNAEVSSADMEMDSDFEMVQNSPNYDGFQFQPPLPPGSPLNAIPPPLPRGTPPATPPNFTPPRPPMSVSSVLPRNASALATSNNSPAVRAEGSAMDEDTLTLEELEEQQRLIWAALEQADGTNSDSDLPGGTPLTGNSVSSSPSRAEPEVLLEEVTHKNVEVLEPELSDDMELKPKVEESENKATVIEKLIDLTEEHGDNKPISAEELVDLTKEEELDGVDSEKMAENCLSTSVNEVNHEKGGGDNPVAHGADMALKITSPIPDMSKFAAGITPFEFENMAESTGIYLRIRSVLKNSPRNQQKNKKSSL